MAFTGLYLGVLIATLPPRYETVVYVGTTYYYANGTYYVLSGTQYKVVPAPVGVVVVNPPAEINVVTVDDVEYGYSNGAYYEAEAPVDDDSDPTFKVVAPPIGATVTELPADALPQDDAGLGVDEDQVNIVAETADLGPDESEEIVANLEPGSYVLICNIPGHYGSGMSSAFTVQ